MIALVSIAVSRRCCLLEIRKMMYTSNGTKRLPKNFCIDVPFLGLLFVSDGSVVNNGAMKIFMKSTKVETLLYMDPRIMIITVCRQRRRR